MYDSEWVDFTRLFRDGILITSRLTRPFQITISNAQQTPFTINGLTFTDIGNDVFHVGKFLKESEDGQHAFEYKVARRNNNTIVLRPMYGDMRTVKVS